MNERLHIENAKVIYVGQFATGNNSNGPWAAINIKVEWDYVYVDYDQQKRTAKQSAVVKLTGDNAVWARDNVKAGNPYANIPDTFLDLWVHTYGDISIQKTKDGDKNWENVTNNIIADYIRIIQPEAQTAQQA